MSDGRERARCPEVLVLESVRCPCSKELTHSGPHEAKATTYDEGDEYQVTISWYRTPLVKH